MLLKYQNDRLSPNRDGSDETYKGVLIRKGDTLRDLFDRDWTIIYNLPVNTRFREIFPNPNMIWPGFYIYTFRSPLYQIIIESFYKEDTSNSEGIFKDDPPFWMLQQIQKDLLPFKNKGINESKIDEVFDKYKTRFSLVRVKIVRQKVSYDDGALEGSKRGCNIFIDALNKLSTLVEIPDVEFLISMRDMLDLKEELPIFVFSKKIDDKFILVPDYDALKKLIWDSAIVKHAWSDKKNVMVWRGSTTGGSYRVNNFLQYARSKAVSLSLQFPDLINARFFGLGQCGNDCELIRSMYSQYFGEHLEIEDQIMYKYQLLIDGNSCAYSRALWQLFSNCVTFKQTSPFIQWYYSAILPYKHYVPIKNDLSDLVDTIHWAKNNDSVIKEISNNAQIFSKNNLSIYRVYQYLYLLLKEYSKCLKPIKKPIQTF